VTIQAQDNKNNNITTGSEAINVSFYLKDTGATPVSVVTVNGRATVNMNMTLAQTGQQIVFTGAASGKIGKSDIFTVQANPTIDHYAVSGPATPQTAGTGFNVTIQAQDTYGNNINTGSETVKVELAKKDNNAIPDSTTTKNGTATFDMDLTVAQTGQQIICTGGTSGKTGASGTFTVNPGTLAAITVSPSAKTLDIKATQQFTATGLDSCGNDVHCTPVWSMMDTDAGHIDTAGLFTAGTKAGTYTNTITATSGAISGYASVTINQTSFPITVTQSGNGTIAPGTTNVNYGGSQTFTITPATGYHITDVLVDGASVGAVSSYSFNNMTSAHSIAAGFAINTYTVTFAPGAHGLITGGTAVQTIPYGGNATAPTITANPGWTFTGWDTTFTNVTANLTVTAQYSQITYTVAFVASAHGIITSGTAVQTIPYGGNATAPTITANPGWTFTGWDTAFTNVTANLTVTAQYSQITYTVTFSAGTHGALLYGNNIQPINYGGTAVSPIVTADQGWKFTGWDRPLTNITAYTVITAQYSQIQYTVTFVVGDHGNLDSGNAVQAVIFGAAADAPVVSPNSGWVFTGWDSSFNNITGDITVTAQYRQVVYIVHFNPGNYGKVTGGFVEQFVDGGQIAIAPEVTAEPGWVFTGWDTSFADIHEDMTITAQYEQVKSDLIESGIVSGAPFIQTQIPLTPDNTEQQVTTAAAITDTEITTTEVNRQAGSITGEPNLSLIAGIIIYSVCCCLVFTLFIVRLRSKRS
jgi:hypothetical protein